MSLYNWYAQNNKASFLLFKILFTKKHDQYCSTLISCTVKSSIVLPKNSCDYECPCDATGCDVTFVYGSDGRLWISGYLIGWVTFDSGNKWLLVLFNESQTLSSLLALSNKYEWKYLFVLTPLNVILEVSHRDRMTF